MKKDRHLVLLVLLVVVSAGCIGSGQSVTPATEGSDTTTTTGDSIGAFAVNETMSATETATETSTATETATETETVTTATETETPTPTATMTATPTEIPLDPPADMDWEQTRETLYCDGRPGEKEKITVDITYTNPNEYAIYVGTGLQLVTDDGTKVSVGGDSNYDLGPGETWTTSFSYTTDCKERIDDVHVANQTHRPFTTNSGN